MKRRVRYGEIRRSAGKTYTVWAHHADAASAHRHAMTVKIIAGRDGQHYVAEACVVSHAKNPRFSPQARRRCGFASRARTPTRAIKAALAHLSEAL